MLIAIPSKARITKQITLGQLPLPIREKVWLAVGVEEATVHQHPYVVVCPPGIGPARQWLCEWALRRGEPKVLMLDDDLTFALRRTDDSTKFTTPADVDIVRLFETVEEKLEQFAHVAISPREGGNRRIEPFILNTRALRALAYRTDILKKHNIRFDEAELMEDFTVQLHLLLKGLPHCSINWMVQNQAGSNLAGGCSTYRTMESQGKAAHDLQARFPDFVRIVKKHTKTAWGGQEREDVVISWKKAYEEGCRVRGSN